MKLGFPRSKRSLGLSELHRQPLLRLAVLLLDRSKLGLRLGKRGVASLKRRRRFGQTTVYLL